MKNIELSTPGFHWQNTSLADLPGEEWKDIFRFEGLYQVSTHGRIKSLQREVVPFTQMRGPRLRLLNPHSHPIKEKIIKPVSTVPKKTNKSPGSAIRVRLNKNGLVYKFLVARLVYCVFVRQFDLMDTDILISYKDGDIRNLHFSNLIKSEVDMLPEFRNFP